MKLAVTDTAYVSGAAEVRDGLLLTVKGEEAQGYDYLELEEALETEWDFSACCSCYSITDFPWIRFYRDRALNDSGLELMVNWLHIELDLPRGPKGKIWSGLAFDGLTWTAPAQSEREIRKIVDGIASVWNYMSRAAWYASRGGLHIVLPIEPIAYNHARAFLTAEVDRFDRLTRKVRGALKVDESCALPTQLQFLPRIYKKGVGNLRLPLSSAVGEPVRLAMPEWLKLEPKKQQRHFTKKDLKLSREEKDKMKRFASNWIASHFKFLEGAAVGDGINARLYALGGDIRQLEEAGLLPDTSESLLEIAAKWDDRGALMNGYTSGTGSDTLTIGMRDIAGARHMNDLAQRALKTLRRL